MKQLLALLIATCLSGIAHAQYCNDARFSEVTVFTETQIFKRSNITYGSALDWQGNMETLKLDLYQPKLAVDTAAKRPLIVYVHGGGFTSGSKADPQFLCEQFAQRGFVAVSINYRLGWNCSSGDSITYNKAAYRAVQDLHASIRYLVANADSFRIDTSWIFVGGGSAGAGTALSLVYVDQQEFNADFPTIEGELGAINASTNNLTNTFTIKGVFENSGGTFPQYIQPQDMLPTIAFHGGADVVVPIDSSLDNGCLTNPMTVYGSRQIDRLLVANGICSNLTVDPNGGHGIYNDNDSQRIFRVSKAACFFKSVMCGSCQTIYTTDSIAPKCSGTATGIAIAEMEWFTLSPNPASQLLHLGGLKRGNGFEATIFNLQGQVVLASNSADINVQNLPAGFYLLKVQQAGQLAVRRFVKE